MKNLLLLLLVSCIWAGAATAQSEQEYVQASGSVQYQYIGTYDLKRLNNIFGAELDDFLTGSPMPSPNFKGKFATPKYPVRLFRVKYRSVVPELGNRPTVSSGLVAIPETGKETMPVLSYQHGTVFSKNSVPSVPDSSMETRLMIAQFAAQGYVVIGADYHGLGISSIPNAYFVKGCTEQACVDMLYAAQDVLAAKNIKPGKLFLHGWSQGGWNNMIFLRKLESLDIPVTAAATASAPLDIAATINRWMNNHQPIDAVYLPACAAQFFFAKENYNQFYDLPRRAIRPQYYQAAKDFTEFGLDWPGLLQRTPKNLQEFLNPEFLTTGNLAGDNFWLLLESMQAYRWRCKTPLINYYGEKDEVVPVYIARLAEDYHRLLGAGSTRAVSAGPDADHRATYVYSIINVKPFFDAFLNP